jgi:hypothetical protein
MAGTGLGLLLVLLGLIGLVFGGSGGLALGGLALAAWGSIMAAIGLTGLYIIRTDKDARGRPLYVVRSTLGLDNQFASLTGDEPVKNRCQPRIVRLWIAAQLSQHRPSSKPGDLTDVTRRQEGPPGTFRGVSVHD